MLSKVIQNDHGVGLADKVYTIVRGIQCGGILQFFSPYYPKCSWASFHLFSEKISDAVGSRKVFTVRLEALAREPGKKKGLGI